MSNTQLRPIGTTFWHTFPPGNGTDSPHARRVLYRVVAHQPIGGGRFAEEVQEASVSLPHNANPVVAPLEETRANAYRRAALQTLDGVDEEVARILAMSDEQVLAECRAEGRDPEQIAAECRTLFEQVKAFISLRTLLIAARVGCIKHRGFVYALTWDAGDGE